MGAAWEGEQMMTEKRDKLTEALTPEEQQSVNAVLERITFELKARSSNG